MMTERLCPGCGVSHATHAAPTILYWPLDSGPFRGCSTGKRTCWREAPRNLTKTEKADTDQTADSAPYLNVTALPADIVLVDDRESRRMSQCARLLFLARL